MAFLLSLKAAGAPLYCKNNRMRTQILALSLAAAALAGCAKDDITPAVGPVDSAVAEKIINTPENSDESKLLIYVDKGLVETSELDSLMTAKGAAYCEPLFKTTDEMRSEFIRLGMNRWYKVGLKDGKDVQEMAYSLASEKKIYRVQYNTYLEPVKDARVRSYATAQTRSLSSDGTLPFNDTYLESQWHYNNNGNGKPLTKSVAGADIDVYDAWKLTGGDPSIIVAVVDEGVDFNHPDLKANMWVNTKEIPGNGVDDDNDGYVDDVYGYNFVDKTWKMSFDKPSYSQGYNVGDSGHGTHVAGVVAAVNNNGQGVCGVAGGTGNSDGVRVMSCQILSGGAGGSTDIVAEAVMYAANHGASILQCSYGFSSGTYSNDMSYKKLYAAEYAAYKFFMEAKRDNPINGGVIIFAAGNDGRLTAGYPGAITEFVAVTSIASDYKPAYYTCYGPGCNIAAPGGEYYTDGTDKNEGAILSTMPYGVTYGSDYDGNGYGYMQGTSMACPHVSGVAALGLSYMKKLGKTCTPDEFKAMLLTSVNDIDKYCIGSKNVGVMGTLQLGKYKGKMGTGLVDAWKLLMQIEGTPCLMAAVGQEQAISLQSVFGTSCASMKFTGVEISDADKAALGLNETPTVKVGKLVILPHKSGCVKITIKAIAGGNVAGSDSQIGGMEISKTISIVARAGASENGGWL